jgi:hypothetical protein
MNKEEVKTKFKKFADTTTFHAITNVVNAENALIRYVWVFFILIMTSLCFVEVVKNLKDYYKYEVDTVVEIVNENEFEFPTLTFCNLQICGFKDYDFQSYLKKYKQDEFEKFGTDQASIIDEKLRKNNTKTSFFSAKEIFLRKYDDNELMKILNKNKTSINAMLLSCKFGDGDCREEDFEFFQMGEFSKCYKFNSGLGFSGDALAFKNTTKFGKNYGFRMELYVGSQEECKSPLTSISGLVIYAHNHTYTLTEEDNGLQVQPGTEVTIAIDRTYVKKLSFPYSDCFESLDKVDKQNQDLIIRTINLTKIYTQQYCLQLCFQDFLIHFCDCYDHTLPNFSPSGKNACSKFIDSLYNCQYLIKRLFYNGKNDEHCLKSCPKECDYIRYDTTISNTKYPAKGYFEFMEGYYNGSFDSKIENGSLQANSILAVSVFYTSSSYTKITEVPSLAFYDLLPNIGGTMGLFLGISVLSFVEIVEIIIEFLTMLLKGLIGKK